MLANRLPPLGEKVEWWNLKRGREDISAYRDCSCPYRKVFEMKKDGHWSPGEIKFPLRREGAQKRLR